ncbi:hypothetical protein AB7W35_22100, partial [Escherichia coli]
MYTRNLLWLVSLVSAAPLYAADVPANTPLAPQQVFRYNNHSDPGTLDPQKVEENTAVNRPGFPGECFICELRLPDHRFRWKH